MTSFARSVLASIAVLGLLVSPAFADRLNDKQLDQHIDKLDRSFDKWKDALEKANYDHAVLKSALATVDIGQFLKDFEKDIDSLEDRFGKAGSAVAEAQAVLRRGTDVDQRYRNKVVTVGASEWAAFSADLSVFADQYATSFPLPSLDATMGRLTDKELAARVQDIERQSKALGKETEKAMKQDKAIPKAARETAKADSKRLEQSAKAVRQRIERGQPASAEVKELLSQTSAMGTRVSGLPLSPQGRTAWSAIDAASQALALAFKEPTR